MRNHMRKTLLLMPLFLCGCPVYDGPKPKPSPSPVVEPSLEMQNLVQKIVPISEPELVYYFTEFADVLSRDSDQITTTWKLREVNQKAGQLMFQKTGFTGKYPSLQNDLNQITIQALGGENGDLNKPKAIELFKALAWASK